MSLAQALKTKKMEMLQKTRRSSSSTTNNFKKLTQKFSLPKEDQKANAKNNTGFSVLHDQENNRSTGQKNDDGNFESKYADEYFFKKISSLELEIGEQPSRKSFDSLDRNFTKSENTDFEDTNELSRRFREIREKVRRSPNTYKSSGSYKSNNTIKIDPTKSTNPEPANNYTNTKSEQIIPKKPLNKRQQREQEQLAKLAALENKNYANFKTVNQPTSELARKLSRTLSNSKNIESSKENSSDKSEDSQIDNHSQNLDVKMVKKIKTPQNIRPTIPAVASNITSELQRKLSKRINSIENHEIRQSRNSSRNISTEVLDRQPSFEDNQSIGNHHKLLTKRVSGSSLCSRRKNVQASFERHNNNKDQITVLKNNENEDFPACYPHFDISASAVEPDKTTNQNSKITIRRKISTISNTDSLSHVSHVSEIEDRDVIVRTTSHKSQHEIDSFGVPVQDALAFFERKGQ